MDRLTNYITIMIVMFLSSSYFCQKTESTTKRIEDSFERRKTIFSTDSNWKLESGKLLFASTTWRSSLDDEEEKDQPGSVYNNYLPDEYSDFTISVNVEFEDGDLFPFGIVFRGNESVGTYNFALYPNNGFILSKYHEREPEVNLAPNHGSDLTTSGYNTLKVTCVGSNIKCYINGQKVADITDKDFLKGKVGLTATSGIRCSFDDFRIGPPEEDIDNISLRESFNGKYSAFSTDENWQLIENRFHFSGGKPELGYYQFISSAIVHDFFISVKAKCSGKIINNGYGLVFGITQNEYYTFLIAQDGHYKLSKWNGSEWIHIIRWTVTDLVKPDFNLLRVNCEDKKIECYINDAKVIDTLYTTYNSGNVGIFSSGSVEAVFDDFVLSPPRYIAIQTEEEKNKPKTRGRGK